jgi:hypothetical protein
VSIAECDAHVGAFTKNRKFERCTHMPDKDRDKGGEEDMPYPRADYYRAYSKDYYYRKHSPLGENYEEFKVKKRVWDKAYRQRNRDKLIEKRAKRRLEFRAWYRQYKANIKCIRCGESDPACLHFHHRSKDEKKITIAQYVFEVYSLENLIEELNKCDVLCANCHMIEHWQERDEAADRLEYERLQQQLEETKGWLPRQKIKGKINILNNVIWLYRYKRTLMCQSCGSSHPACLQFHHQDRNNKRMEVGNLRTTSINILKREIAKCKVLCANCHAKHHWGEIYKNNGDSL